MLWLGLFPLMVHLYKHDGSQQFIDLLFRPERILLNVLPVMGALSTLTPTSGHDFHLAKQDRLIVA